MRDDGLDDLVDVGGGQHDRHRVDSPANSLNRQALPSITGSAAAGPMLPRPSTAVPSETTATTRGAQVNRRASSGRRRWRWRPGRRPACR